MAKEKTQISANPLKVAWPQDQFQITQVFKASGLELASRVGDQKDKLEVAVATLDVLREHMIARYMKYKEIRADQLDQAKARRAMAAEVETAAKARRVAALKAELAHLEPGDTKETK